MMSNLHIQTEQPPPSQVPLLTSISNQQQQQNHETVSNSNNNNNNNNNNSNNNDDESKTELDQTLARVETYLTLLGFNQSSIFTFILSWTLFATVGVALPLIALRFINCSSFNCERFDIKSFEIDIVAFQASLAAVSLLCLSHNLRKYGLRRFLFVDRHGGNMACFHNDYVKQISGSMRLLILWLLPCILLKTVREIIRASYAQQGSWQLSLVLTLALIISWTYVSAISLSASILFHLVCNLQVIHFDDYGKLLQRESDVLVFMEEHIRLRYHLSKISHRFRIYLLLGFLVVTASQCVTLLQVTGYAGSITFINGGDFAASTIVQVVGIIICLHAATRISHRAQSVVSLANMWHALLTCTSSDPSQMRNAASSGSLEAANRINSIHLDYSENDLESMDFARSGMPTNTQLASYLSSHHRRQAFVMYLQTNPGGITIFGWTVDRSFVNTIFFLELSLVTFVLSKTII
ncbi:PREDICTED: putative phosphatidylinositol N-acetylglucosaminyltransferase subunit C isoform X1 [Lupinus angustifolius]|uniref:putative phosphatidylinositol N-acetylglucosaminyltransferase subunit C isoform X1 n=1 Tax=Lupinus angustifolius TaxID=3871 RepID=UPI00092FC8ED|nr:PREDICTED: putative phosphatidylinositol N-acetylglucosaminyltransferase subunit C isoform X1 [Lupinus angustifolius]